MSILHRDDSGRIDVVVSTSTEERDEILELARRALADGSAQMSRTATVVMAEGLMGAIHRSILTGFTLLVPPPHPAKIFADVPRAAAFLLPYIAQACGPASAEDVEAMVAELHALIGEQQASSAPT